MTGFSHICANDGCVYLGKPSAHSCKCHAREDAAMTAESRFEENIRAIDAALSKRRNNGGELFAICKEMINSQKARTAEPLAISLLAEAVDRYRRDNFEQRLVDVAATMKEQSDA